MSSDGSILLVGCGKMGAALLRGWLDGKAGKSFLVVEPAGRPSGFSEADPVAFCGAAGEIPAGFRPDAVILAVKPQAMEDALPTYRRFVDPATVFLSIAAGKTIRALEALLGAAAIVRTMPNTPAAIGRGITVACANPLVTPGQRRLCDGLLAAAGESAWVEDEAMIDAVTAVSGSGPAYVFLLIETLAAAGISAGLPAALAQRLALATVAGSGELARRSDEPASRLRENVTSPGGTTRAALDVLMADDGMAPLMQRAVMAAARRSRELAR